jgi:hypothetical protein
MDTRSNLVWLLLLVLPGIAQAQGLGQKKDPAVVLQVKDGKIVFVETVAP